MPSFRAIPSIEQVLQRDAVRRAIDRHGHDVPPQRGAQRLAITPKTAETHIERIYAKTGASTRSTATLFAMQHGLLDSLEPLYL